MSDLEWVKIPGFSGYEINRNGEVRSYRRIGRALLFKGPFKETPHLLSRMTNKDGYPFVVLVRDDKKRIHTPLHVHVLTTFIGPKPEGCFALHKDDDRSNLSPDNLYWGTKKDNMRDRLRNLRNPGQVKLSTDRAIAIVQEFRRGVTGVEIARRFGVSPQVVSHVVTGRTWKEASR